jgi:hypothetical protein
LASKPVATVSWLSFKIKVVEGPDLCLKIGSYSLVILVSKSLRRFLGLGLKTKQYLIYRLRHKINGRMRRRGTRVEM